MVIEENFLRLTVTVRLQKKLVLQQRELSYTFFKSASYKNVVEPKQIYFSPKFLKSWVCTSDNVAGVV